MASRRAVSWLGESFSRLHGVASGARGWSEACSSTACANNLIPVPQFLASQSREASGLTCTVSVPGIDSSSGPWSIGSSAAGDSIPLPQDRKSRSAAGFGGHHGRCRRVPPPTAQIPSFIPSEHRSGLDFVLTQYRIALTFSRQCAELSGWGSPRHSGLPPFRTASFTHTGQQKSREFSSPSHLTTRPAGTNEWKETFRGNLRRDNSLAIGYRVVRSNSPGEIPDLSPYLAPHRALEEVSGNVQTGAPEEDVGSDSSGPGAVEAAAGDHGPRRRHIQQRPVFAVVQVGSHQFKVTPGDVIYVEKLLFADINDTVHLTRILLVGSRHDTVVGRPDVPDVCVVALVEEHALDAKVIVFKKKRRKNYRRHRGHRQELTRLLILGIESVSEALRAAAAVQEEGGPGPADVYGGQLVAGGTTAMSAQLP